MSPSAETTALPAEPLLVDSSCDPSSDYTPVVPTPVPTLESLRAMPVEQQPRYSDPQQRRRVVQRLRVLAPLVRARQCDELRSRLADVAGGRAFLLQGGDCAETFAGVRADNIGNKVRVLSSMATVMADAAGVPVVAVGRIAGQYAKPRSRRTETRDGVELPSYRGDAVNGFEFTARARQHDPERLERMYRAAAATLELVTGTGRHRRVWASHEALLLDYEHSLTRVDERSQLPYDLSGHLVWLGERTRRLDGAHVAFLRSVHNPLGVKLGPSATAQQAVALAEALDPRRTPGRLTVITRMGAGRVRRLLPPIIKAVEATGRSVVWCCDPMHGNTFETANGYKTRSFHDICAEVNGFFDVHEELGTRPGGVHVELTGDDVTECLGGTDALAESDLGNRYETVCDPRLNRNQSMELAQLVADRLTRSHGSHAQG